MNPVVAALATKRLTQLVVEDELTRPLRDRVGRWGDAHPEASLQNRLSYLVTCSACTSVWAAMLVLLAQRNRVGRFGTRLLALSAAALFVDSVVGRLER